MMTVILLTAPICGLFWKMSSFLISLADGGIKFRRFGKGISQNEDRHDPPFNVFRGRSEGSGRNCPEIGAVRADRKRSRGRRAKNFEKGRHSPVADGWRRGRGAGRSILVWLGLLDRRPLRGLHR